MATKNTPSKNFKRKYGQNSPIPNQQAYLRAYKDAEFFRLNGAFPSNYGLYKTYNK